MLLGDVLKVVGTSELRDFPWGSNVVSLVNSFVPEQAQLSLSSTGAELAYAVGLVDEDHRPILLQARIGVTVLGKRESSANDDETDDTVAKAKTRSIVTIGFTSVLCLIAVVLTLGMSISSVKHGTELDASSLTAILKMITEVITSL